MSTFPKNFPFGKSMWIWELWACVNKPSFSAVTPDDLQTIITKLKANDIQTVIIKCGDGENTWEQFTPDVLKAFHDAGLKVLSWSFVYGQNPQREAAIAMWALDMGADGHVFDAEDQYEKLADPAGAANQMLQAVRAHNPEALLGYSPEPIIDYHQYFPYVEFGKYCDFVMPQIYFGEWKKSPSEAVDWVYEQWSKWQEQWSTNGFADSIKPMLPVCQCYDDYTIDFVITPDLISQFIQTIAGYKAVAFWSYQHMLRDDLWTAVREGKLLAPAPEDLGLTDALNGENSQNSTPATQTPETDPSLQTSEQPQSTPQDGTSAPVAPADGTSTPASAPAATTNPTLPTLVDLPDAGHTTITVKKNPNAASGLDIKVTHYTPDALKVKAFFTGIFSRALWVVNKLNLRGGEQK